MKKLLVLLMFLALVAGANARVFLSLDGTNEVGTGTIALSGSVTVYVVSDSELDYFRYLDLVKTYANMATPTIHEADVIGTGHAGDDATVVDYSTGTLWDYEITAADLESPYSSAVGVHFFTTVTATGTVDDVIEIELLDGDTYALLDDLDLTIVPEPMTVALLGLGGLFLRRRK